jgi:hypothetical protein
MILDTVNEKIKSLLDPIKDGAKIISLRELVPISSRRITTRTVS